MFWYTRPEAEKEETEDLAAARKAEEEEVRKDSSKRKNNFLHCKPKPETLMNRNDKPPDNRKSDLKDHNSLNNQYNCPKHIHNLIPRRNIDNYNFPKHHMSGNFRSRCRLEPIGRTNFLRCIQPADRLDKSAESADNHVPRKRPKYKNQCRFECQQCRNPEEDLPANIDQLGNLAKNRLVGNQWYGCIPGLKCRICCLPADIRLPQLYQNRKRFD